MDLFIHHSTHTGSVAYTYQTVSGSNPAQNAIFQCVVLNET